MGFGTGTVDPDQLANLNPITDYCYEFKMYFTCNNTVITDIECD